MSFFDYLENLRRRPAAVRQKLLLLWSISGTLMIIVLWLINFLVFQPNADYDNLASQEPGFIHRHWERIYSGLTVIKGQLSNWF